MRYAPIIEHLAERHELDVLVLANASSSPPVDEWIAAAKCRVQLLEPPNLDWPVWMRKFRTALISMVPWGLPYGMVPNRSMRQIEAWLRSILAGKTYDTVVIGGPDLDIAMCLRRIVTTSKLVADLVDSPTLSRQRRAASGGLAALFDDYMIWKCRRLEHSIRRSYDSTIYISTIDADTLGGDRGEKVSAVPNGVFVADAPDGLSATGAGSGVIGFLGSMAYEPNVEAAIRLVTRIFPKIAASRPDASVLIIGRDPVPEILALRSSRVAVTGTVADIWPYIQRTDAFVFPMVTGAGLQNKILDAMLGKVPVVTTPIAADSIRAVAGRELLVGDTDDEIAEQVLKLLESRDGPRAELTNNAARFLRDNYSWSAILARYESIVLGDEAAS